MRHIPLVNGDGLYALVDDSDYELLSQLRWRPLEGDYTIYAVCDDLYALGHTGLMHRLIMGLNDELLVVDHGNGLGLDNRRQNLEVVTRAVNNSKERRRVR